MSNSPMILQLPGNGTLTGFSYFWGWYVTGFNPEQHCQKCLFGWRSELVKNRMRVGTSIVLDERPEFDYFYLCGGDEEWKYHRNFHLALRRKGGWDTKAECATGQKVIVRNSEYIEIPPLPEGFNGKDTKFTTCRNYQFGVSVYQMDRNRVPNDDGTYGFRPELDAATLARMRGRGASRQGRLI